MIASYHTEEEMTGIQIFLLIIGIITIVGSFVFSEFLDKGQGIDGDSLSGIRYESIQKKVNDVVEVAVNEAVDEEIEARLGETERQLEKICNEKIMAVSRYSENVLNEISKNHDEVMFLYGMLKDKESDIKNTVLDVEAVKKSIRAMESQQVVQEQKQTVTKKKENNTQFKHIEKSEPVKKGAAKQDTSNHNQRILTLFEQGKTAMEIAKELNLGIGEVQLVIDLYVSKK